MARPLRIDRAGAWHHVMNRAPGHADLLGFVKALLDPVSKASICPSGISPADLLAAGPGLARAPPTNAPPKLPGQILISASGQVSLNGQTYSLPQLRPILASMKSADPELALVVKGARSVDYQYVVSVLDLVQQLDITKVGLATENAGDGR